MLAALKRNEKGLTLIELLAVLVIIGIIAAIAIPAIGATIRNAENKANEASIAMVEDATQRYLLDHQITPFTGDELITFSAGTAVTGNNATTLVETLEEAGYLAEVPTFKGFTTANLSIMITNPESGRYEVVVTRVTT